MLRPRRRTAILLLARRRFRVRQLLVIGDVGFLVVIVRVLILVLARRAEFLRRFLGWICHGVLPVLRFPWAKNPCPGAFPRVLYKHASAACVKEKTAENACLTASRKEIARCNRSVPNSSLSTRRS